MRSRKYWQVEEREREWPVSPRQLKPTLRSEQVGKQECSRPRSSASTVLTGASLARLFLSFIFSPIPAPSPFNFLFAFSLSLSSNAFSCLSRLSFFFFSFLCPLVLLFPSSRDRGQSHRKAIFHRVRKRKQRNKQLLRTHKSKCCCIRTRRSAPDGHNSSCPTVRLLSRQTGKCSNNHIQDKWTSDKAWSFKWDP